jgi:uncharacterized protein (TIGR00369 family)
MADRELTVSWEDPAELVKHGGGSTGVELLRAMVAGELPRAPIQSLIGFELVEVDEGRVVFVGYPGEQHYNPIGTVHGGFAATLLDSALGAAVHTTLAAGEGYITLELKLNLVRPITAETGEVRAEGRVIHRGKTVATSGADLRDGAGKLLAHATSTCLIR